MYSLNGIYFFYSYTLYLFYEATNLIRTDDLWLYIRWNVLCRQIRHIYIDNRFIVNVHLLAFVSVWFALLHNGRIWQYIFHQLSDRVCYPHRALQRFFQFQTSVF